MKKIDYYKFIIPKTDDMRVEGLIFADDVMIKDIKKDNSWKQVANVASLPGIVGRSMAMPDIHYGYGFPIGGVAAFDLEEGVISPGGIGYDINCGVRLLKTNLHISEVTEDDVKKICDSLYKNVPSGVGSSGKINISESELKKVLKDGAKWAVQNGYGCDKDLEYSEENGCFEGADPKTLSKRAITRGRPQLGTLGSGNHFLELQFVGKIFDSDTADQYGLKDGQITLMIHTGSRGLGFQVCDDYLKVMREASSKYNIDLADRQLACAPYKSSRGQRYFSAMKCAANYAWANRQCIMSSVRETLRDIMGKRTEVELLYDVCHNIGKVEEHKGRKLLLHRKGATRAFGPGRKELPDEYVNTGQPVLIPGTMGSSSYVLKGTEKAMGESFGSTCHGAGRTWSRTRAKKSVKGSQLREELRNRKIYVMAKRMKTIAEEAPQAYKDVSRVVNICHNAGLSERVAKLAPAGVVKG